MARAKKKRDGGKVLIRSFTDMCARLDFMNEVLHAHADHMQDEHINFVIDNAYAIEQEWMLDPLMRSPGNGGIEDQDDYTEYLNDA